MRFPVEGGMGAVSQTQEGCTFGTHHQRCTFRGCFHFNTRHAYQKVASCRVIQADLVVHVQMEDLVSSFNRATYRLRCKLFPALLPSAALGQTRRVPFDLFLPQNCQKCLLFDLSFEGLCGLGSSSSSISILVPTSPVRWVLMICKRVFVLWLI